MTHFPAHYRRAVIWILALVASTLGGLQLSRWIARGNRDARDEPSERAGSVHFPKTPDLAVTATWAELFNAARKEIWLSAGRLDSEIVFRALGAAANRRVVVHVTLSPTQNSNPESGARGWLRQRTSIRDVRISRHGFVGAACVVDGTYVVVTAQDLVAANASAADGGIFFYATDPGIGAALRARLAAQYADARPDSAKP